MNELSDQVRGIIFVVLVLLVIGVWSHFYTPPAAPVQKGLPDRITASRFGTINCGSVCDEECAGACRARSSRED